MTINQGSVIKKISDGCVGVMPTDTIYGIVASTEYPNSIERIYSIKDRDYDKPFVILIADTSQLSNLGVAYTPAQKAVLEKVWPGPVSVVLPCVDQEKEYLHRGMQSLAVRMPKPEWLRQILRSTGPIVATSVNKQGEKPCDDIEQIKKKLPVLDFYIAGKIGDQPSQIIKVDKNGKTTRLR